MEKELDITKQCLVDDCVGFWENLRDWESDDFGGIYYNGKGLPDPDTYGYLLYNFHEALWNIQRLKFKDIKGIPELRNNSDYEYNKKKSVGGQYVRVLSNADKSIRLGSDSIMSIYWHTCGNQVLVEQLKNNKEQKQYINSLNEVEKLNSDIKKIRKYNENDYKSDWKKFIWLYLQKSNTIGGFILFPRKPMSINGKRGLNSQIGDRFDLTLECIRRYYTKSSLDNPLYDVLWQNKEFFDMFKSFENYAKFFCLDESWIKDGHVLNLMDNKELDTYDFTKKPLPTNSTEWWRFYGNIMDRLDARNEQIKKLLEEK